MKKFLLVILIITIVLAAIYFTTGLFVIQPIGAIPEGATIWYLRFGINMPFISSADGLILSANKSVSLLTRAVMLGSVGKILKDRMIVRFPYNETLYLFSTGGVKFERQ